MAKRSKTGPVQDNPAGAKVVNMTPVDENMPGMGIDLDAALAPARATHNPDRDFDDPELMVNDVQEETPPTQETQPEGSGEQVADAPEWQKDHRFKGDPEKFYGSYREMEKKMHELSAEASEYRNFVNQYIQKQILEPKPAQAQPENPGEPSPQDVELLNKMLGQPSKFVEELKGNWMNELRQQAMANEVARVRHENADVYSNPEFLGWVRNNVPFQLAQEADRDPQALKYVLNTYRQISGSQQQAQQVRQGTQEELAQKAKIVQSAAGAPSSSRASGEKVWTTREIMKMMTENPSQYNKLSRPGGAIYEAYRNGRVKD